MSDFIDIFLYNKETPLLFTMLYFWVFFFIVLTIYSIIHKKTSLRNGYLFFASLFFYYKTSGFFFLILLFTTFSNFLIGKRLYTTESILKKKWLVALSVIINLGLLLYFKYAYFLTETLNQIFHLNAEVVNYLALWANQSTGTHFEINQILLPVGISFFTFQTISYIIDVYKGKVQPVKSMLDFGFYVSFFPQLVAGPIVRASHFVPQMYKDFKLSKYEFGLATFWILKGLFKKMFIGDYIAVNFIDRVFENPLFYTGFENLMAIFGYSLQVYLDFSGYTDIAIGIALLMGFRIPPNFNSPYKARNVGEFWKRWHISLSSWLKDYLYIPMGGNREGSLFTYIAITVILAFIVLLSGQLWLAPIFASIAISVILLSRLFPKFRLAINTNINLMTTMLLGGLWHGASWQFIIWGGLNGIGLVVYKFWRKISPWEGSNTLLARFWTIFLTFNFITFTRIFFRSESMEVANKLMYQISHDFSFDLIPDILYGFRAVFLIMLLGYVFHWLPTPWKDVYRKWYIRAPATVKVLVIVAIIFTIYQSLSAELQPFIYFQF